MDHIFSSFLIGWIMYTPPFLIGWIVYPAPSSFLEGWCLWPSSEVSLSLVSSSASWAFKGSDPCDLVPTSGKFSSHCLLYFQYSCARCLVSAVTPLKSLPHSPTGIFGGLFMFQSIPDRSEHNREYRWGLCSYRTSVSHSKVSEAPEACSQMWSAIFLGLCAWSQRRRKLELAL